MTINMYMKDVVTDLHATAKSPSPFFFIPRHLSFLFVKSLISCFFLGRGGLSVLFICSLFFSLKFFKESHITTRI